MKLATARKIAAHLAVGFAFASIATEGDLPLPVLPAFAAVLVASFFTEGRLARGRSGLFTALTGLVLVVLAALWLTGVFDLVVSASLFAATLAANRLLSRQSAADDGLLYLSALLMLAGGAALTAELLYGLFFTGFAVSTTAALTLSHLSRVVEEVHASPAAADRLASRRLLLGLSGLAVAALGGAIVIFFAFPRFTAGAFGRQAKPSRAATVGFSEQLRLDDHGTLKSDPRPAVRFSVEPDPRAAQLGLLWKGKTFDLYDGRAWVSVPRQEGHPRPALRVREPQAGESAYRVEVLPAVGSAAVFQLGGASVFERARYLRPSPRLPSLFFVPDALGDLKVRPASEQGFSYEMRAGRPASALRGAGTDYPEKVRRVFLQLPDELDPRVRELAARLTRGLEEPLDKAEAIERHLAGFGYSTEVPEVEGDPLAHFLFERKAGHCEFFSTAMAVLLRAAGVPTRNATGFYGGVREDDGRYILRAGDAHSWTEVYFPGTGFVAFDPTPPGGRAADPSGLLAWALGLYERVSTPWRNLFVDLTFWDQFRAVRSAFRAIAEGLSRFQGRSGAGAAGFFNLVGSAIVLTLSFLVARSLWRPSSKQRTRRKRWFADRRAATLYRQLLSRLARQGFAKTASQTPRELARRVEIAGAPFAPAVSQITERYLAARYGGRPLEASEALRLNALLREVKPRKAAAR